jgi:putative peptidoglycan lipid II flippase
MMFNNDDVIRSSAVMAAGTLISRATGFIRNIIIVALFGTSLLGDAYNVGNTTPNILYNLLIGGALTAVFLPQIVRAMRDGDGGALFISRLTTLILALLFLITLAAMALAPVLLKIYAPTFSGREAEISLIFIWFCLPQIFFYGLFAILGQIANARGVFGPMAWAPIVNNLVVIVIFSLFLFRFNSLTIGEISDGQVRALGAATTLGIISQALVLIPVIRKLSLNLKPNFKWRGVGLNKSIRLAGWSVIYALITQIGFLITVNLGTRITKEADQANLGFGAGFTPYQNAYLVFLLPFSIFTISIATSILPKLSSLVQESQVLESKNSPEPLEEVKAMLIRAIRLVMVLAIPSALLLLFFGPIITHTIFFGVGFDDARFIGKILTAFSLALIPLSLNLIFIRALNAFENTKLQTISNFAINTIAALLSFLAYLILPLEWKMVGIALAFTASYFLGIFITFSLLKRYLGELKHSRYLYLIVKLTLISTLIYAPFALFSLQVELTRSLSALFLAGVITICGYLYFFIAKKAGVKEVVEIKGLLGARLSR